jgi:hypothetical protein
MPDRPFARTLNASCIGTFDPFEVKQLAVANPLRLHCKTLILDD